MHPVEELALPIVAVSHCSDVRLTAHDPRIMATGPAREQQDFSGW
jgi:hypothetical protein